MFNCSFQTERISVMSTRKIYSYVCASVPPVADLRADPAHVAVDVNVILDGSDSIDDGTIVKCEWDWTNNGTYDYNETPGDKKAEHSYSSPGAYTVKLRVTDNDNLTDTDTCVVYVNTTWYVDVDADGNDDGTCWTDAFNDLQDAISAAIDGDPIWVADGTYYPTDGNDRSIFFDIGEGVSLYGGFVGNETDINDRDWTEYETILSGDINEPNDANDNSYNLFWIDGGIDNVVIDGFIIRDAHANGPAAPQKRGAGLLHLSSVGEEKITVANCVFKQNWAEVGGGGMVTQIDLVTMTNCVFVDNTTDGKGGGLYCFALSDVNMTNCVFTGNSAEDGGAIYNAIDDFRMVNCTVVNNDANDDGGGIYNVNSDPSITNCIFWGNEAVNDGNEVFNSIDPNSDPNFSYCDIEGGLNGSKCGGNDSIDGGGNINSNPYFANAEHPAGLDGIFCTWDDGLRILFSNCIDAADGNSAPSKDILGLERVDVDGVNNEGRGDPNYVDIGAYEFAPVRYVDVGATGSGNGYSWANAFTTIQACANDVADGDIVLVAGGTYVENIELDGNDMILTSTDLDAPYSAIIDGDNNYCTILTDLNLTIAGFKIINGLGYGIDCNSGSIAFSYCNVTDNGYGIIHLSWKGTSLDAFSVDNCTVSGNNWGGCGIVGQTATISNSEFNDNGGWINALELGAYSSTIYNCTFSGNGFGGIHVESNANITNCIISENGEGSVSTVCGVSGMGTITGCQIINNYEGDGLAFWSGDVTDCNISGNEGYGVYNSYGTITNCNIIGNDGVGVQFNDSTTIANCIIAKNEAGVFAMLSLNKEASITNCTIVSNESYGIELYSSGDLEITNCIIWDCDDDLVDCDATYSCIQDGDSGTGNISSNPCFVNAGANDFHLEDVDSPCIDVGDPNGDYTGQVDMDGDDRVIDITGKGDDVNDVDMGADEHDPNS